MKKCILISFICATLSFNSFSKTINEILWDKIQSHKVSKTETVGDRMRSLTGDTGKKPIIVNDGCSGFKIFIYDIGDKYVEIPFIYDDGVPYTMYEYHRDNVESSFIVVDKAVINQLERDFGNFSDEEVQKVFRAIYKGNIYKVLSYNIDMIDDGIYTLNVVTRNGVEIYPIPSNMLQ